MASSALASLRGRRGRLVLCERVSVVVQGGDVVRSRTFWGEASGRVVRRSFQSTDPKWVFLRGLSESTLDAS